MCKKIFFLFVLFSSAYAHEEIDCNERMNHGPKAVVYGTATALSCVALYASVNKFREDMVPLTSGISKMFVRSYANARQNVAMTGLIVACVGYSSYSLFRSCLKSARIFLTDDEESYEGAELE